ncbi:MAG: ribokinase [Spirochaetaceae bacterium]|jgi:ribokinase|nr:ribokinase [Spirochaetaceae bacterium]
MKILVYGSLNVDLIFSVDHIVRPGETISSSAFKRSAGGKGANQSAALAKAGMEVYLAGKIGQDGLFLIDLLKSYGVNTNNVIIDEGSTGQALIQVDKKGQNSIVLNAGGNYRITIDEIKKTLKYFSIGDAVLLQNEIVHTKEIMLAAKEQGLRIYLNPSPFDEGIKSLPLELVDIFFVNEIEAASLAGMMIPPPNLPQRGRSSLAEMLAAQFPNSEIVLTAGEEGAFYAHKTAEGMHTEHCGIVEVPVVDTTGAGDTFSGYFLAGMTKGLGPAECLTLASKAASIAVSRPGAMDSVPYERELA